MNGSLTRIQLVKPLRAKVMAVFVERAMNFRSATCLFLLRIFASLVSDEVFAARTSCGWRRGGFLPRPISCRQPLLVCSAFVDSLYCQKWKGHRRGRQLGAAPVLRPHPSWPAARCGSGQQLTGVFLVPVFPNLFVAHRIGPSHIRDRVHVVL